MKSNTPRKLTLYRMRYGVPLIQELECSLIDAFEIQRNEFSRGTSCCQIIIDEENKFIFSLDKDEHLSEDFEYKLNGNYKVFNSNYFNYLEDLEDLCVLSTNFTQGNK